MEDCEFEAILVNLVKLCLQAQLSRTIICLTHVNSWAPSLVQYYFKKERKKIISPDSVDLSMINYLLSSQTLGYIIAKDTWVQTLGRIKEKGMRKMNIFRLNILEYTGSPLQPFSTTNPYLKKRERENEVKTTFKFVRF